MTVIARENARNENMIIHYRKELETLPRGKITPKTVNGKTYDVILVTFVFIPYNRYNARSI